MSVLIRVLYLLFLVKRLKNRVIKKDILNMIANITTHTIIFFSIFLHYNFQK